MISSLYPPFKKWTEKGSIWLISDPHFDDDDCRIMNPNWINPEEHITEINRKVFKNDYLICLGDCGNLERFNEIKCPHKVLVRGNHDDKGNSKYEPYFEEVYSGPVFISPQILLSHEPVFALPFATNIHGHCHNGEYSYLDEFGCRHLNIAADVVQWQVINLGKLIKNGLTSGVPTIHRICIDGATDRSLKDNI